VNDEAIIAALWERFRERATGHLDVLEAWARGEQPAEAALTSAHKLAGSLGSYGRPEGSRIALELEQRLREGPAAADPEVATLLGSLRASLR
jgi:HPt (histidine-containing phosphotransfer) domain-containing protein